MHSLTSDAVQSIYADPTRKVPTQVATQLPNLYLHPYVVMDSPAKGQKLFTEGDEFSPKFDDEDETYSESEEDDFIDDNDFIVNDPGYNPDEELQQKRAQLDFKLKSTFEAIFEKYGKDFDGVGDEIDLRTGEILVNNGHLAEMQDERDAGDRRAGGSLLRALTVEPKSATENSGEEDEEHEDDDAQNDTLDVGDLSDGDMLEDDMILRGCDDLKLDSFVGEATETKVPTFRDESESEVQQTDAPRSNGRVASFPSYHELVKSFGPEVAPEIVNIIARQQAQDDSHIEPAWRAPSIPLAPAGKRPTLKTYVPQLEIERTPSPELSESVWALPKGRGRPKYRPEDSTGIHSDDQGESSLVRSRNAFTAEEDEFLIARVAEAQKQGLRFSQGAIWKRIEEENPRHNGFSWKKRYRAKYWHLWTADGSAQSHVSDGVEDESELDTEFHSNNAHSRTIFERPTRVRKRAQQGPDVVSWSDAVAAIKTLDKRLHKDLIRDARAYDFSDVGFVKNEDEGLDLGTSDRESPEKTDDEPEGPTPTGPAVQRIAPVAANPLYEFSDEEAAPPTLAELPLNTPKLVAKKKSRKPRTTTPNDASGKQSKSRINQTKKLLAFEDVDELSLGADDCLYICSLPKRSKGKSSEPATSLKSEEKEELRETLATIQPRSAKRVVPIPSVSEEFDELGAEWTPSPSMSAPRLQKHARRDVADSTNKLTGSSGKTPKDDEIDLFDVSNLPDISPTTALEMRTKAKAERKGSMNGISSSRLVSSPGNNMSLPKKTGMKRKRSDAGSNLVVASTSSEQSSSATDHASHKRVKARPSSSLQGANGESVVPSTSSPLESSPTIRLKRRVSQTERDGLLSAKPPKTSNRNSPPVSNSRGPLSHAANFNANAATPSKSAPGSLTPSQTEARRSRTPLLDFISPNPKISSKNGGSKNNLQSPTMIKTPGGTMRKCGLDGFRCQRSFCFRCGSDSYSGE
ncbi:myb-like dna-binding domain protein [Rutstroemia sp. NJR-2017a WRK4]|nr:myb-like dna-binding domain protein [Rutstroemia sp. NJR-2017a WRK4]